MYSAAGEGKGDYEITGEVMVGIRYTFGFNVYSQISSSGLDGHNLLHIIL